MNLFWLGMKEKSMDGDEVTCLFGAATCDGGTK